jgi:F0F1-type ATP synthase membrane subunit b/b'
MRPIRYSMMPVKKKQVYDAILSAAKKDAEGLLARAREEIEREREQMVKCRGQVTGLL